MSLRNQPYIPLYIQDYLTDEKLNMCSWKTQGIYIKILCILHKQKEYGCILFKQNDKQNTNKVFYFASILIKNIPCSLEDMAEALDELIENEVLRLDEEKLYQKRMIKDNYISEQRSKAGKKGGGNPNFVKTNLQTNSEYENEDEIENKEELKYEKPTLLKDPEFDPAMQSLNIRKPYRWTKEQIRAFFKEQYEENKGEPGADDYKEIGLYVLKNGVNEVMLDNIRRFNKLLYYNEYVSLRNNGINNDFIKNVILSCQEKPDYITDSLCNLIIKWKNNKNK